MLTGTPIQNNLMELLGLLLMLDPSLFELHFGDLENLFNQKVTLKDVSDGVLLNTKHHSLHHGGQQQHQ
jgi:SWI/SNF-related matrix-associated actin-dependent regulator 1 of chromatin subfamily A